MNLKSPKAIAILTFRFIQQTLINQATQSNIPLPTLILQALRRQIQTSKMPASQWSEAILSYEGIADFPPFESYRDELLPPGEPELF